MYANVCHSKKVKSPIIVFGFIWLSLKRLIIFLKIVAGSNHFNLLYKHDMHKRGRFKPLKG